MKIFFNKASLCFSLLLLSGAVYAQSDDTKQVVLEKKMKGTDFIDKKRFGSVSALKRWKNSNRNWS